MLLIADHSAADGAVLTSFVYANATNASRWTIGDTVFEFPPHLASSILLHEIEDTDTGTLAISSLYGLAQSFFHAPYYAAAAVEYAFAITKRFALGETLTFGTENLHAPGFKALCLSRW